MGGSQHVPVEHRVERRRPRFSRRRGLRPLQRNVGRLSASQLHGQRSHALHTMMHETLPRGNHGRRGAALAATARDVTPRHRGGAALAHPASAVITPTAGPCHCVVQSDVGVRPTPRLSCKAPGARMRTRRHPTLPLWRREGALSASSACSAAPSSFPAARSRSPLGAAHLGENPRQEDEVRKCRLDPGRSLVTP